MDMLLTVFLGLAPIPLDPPPMLDGETNPCGQCHAAPSPTPTPKGD